MSGEVTVAGVTISKPDKELFPAVEGAAPVTKSDLARYYDWAAELMLPHLKDRPVNMQRFPDGIDGPSFYEKKVPGHFPGFVRTVEVGTSDGPQRQVVVSDARSLAYLAQQACITPHTWLSTIAHLDQPISRIPHVGLRSPRACLGDQVPVVVIAVAGRASACPRDRNLAHTIPLIDRQDLGVRLRRRIRTRGGGVLALAVPHGIQRVDDALA